MCTDASCLGYLLLLVIFGFAALIYFGLKGRDKFLAGNLQISPDQIWNQVSQKAQRLGLSKADLLYGIYQDRTSSIQQLVVKNSNGDVVGSIDRTTGVRGLELSIGNEKYLVESPLTWRKSAILKTDKGETIAKFERQPMSFKQLKRYTFDLQGVGLMEARSPMFQLRYPYDFELNGRIIGLTEAISTTRQIGSIAVFPGNLSLAHRFFILGLSAYGY